MYQQHFGLTEKPFNLTPDTQFFCQLPPHQEALNVLLLALNNGEGFIKITGDVGTGKTLLCRKLLNELGTHYQTAYLPNPHLTPAGLRKAIADEFSIAYAQNINQQQMLRLLNQTLIQISSRGQQAVLIIDEAQAMSLETLEALRLLTNLETEKQKLLQIVLFAQPELDVQLKHQSIRQLKQRITFSYQLRPLNYAELVSYINQRLNTANCTQTNIFSRSALKALHYYSRGIPRLINILAHKAMLVAYGRGLTTMTKPFILMAALDTEDCAKTIQQHHYKNMAYALLVWLIMVALALYALRYI
ncbi:MAG: AAA family ATPase [Methylococcaceae bacterium]|nr:AAA family ATPase [Methylococcaceae bacterium]